MGRLRGVRALIQPLRIAAARYSGIAGMAFVYSPAQLKLHRRLEKRFLAGMVAVWTKPMRGFNATCLWLKHIDEGSKSELLQLVTLLVRIPFHKLSVFCFERAYFIQLRRLRLVGAEQPVLDVCEKVVQFSRFLDKEIGIPKQNHALREIIRCAKSRYGGGDFSGGH